MSCSHCKGSITPVVIDESLTDFVTYQAKVIHQLERLLVENKIEFTIDKKGIYIDQHV